MKTHYDAIIVGAGPAGATAAILLARAGWSVALIEKQPFPRRKVCGECIAASNLPLLRAIGIDMAAFDATAGAPLRQVVVMQGATSRTFDLPPAQSAGMEWGRALGRETLDTWLLDLARQAGASVWQPWAVESLDGTPGAFRCALRNTQSTNQNNAGGAVHITQAPQSATFTAPVAILANGSWEPLPAQREQRRRNRSASDLFAFKANFQNGSLAPGLLPVLSFPGGYGGMVVADAGITTLACCVRADRLEALRREQPGCSAGEVVEAMLRREVAGVNEALGSAQREGSWMASGPLLPGIRLRSDDLFFRIGNAAAEAHPIIGEGMSMAMQSAWLLCAQLLAPMPSTLPVSRPAAAASARENSADVAIWQAHVSRRYAHEWHAKFSLRLKIAAVLAHAAMRPRLYGPLLHLVQHWPAAVSSSVKWCGKTRTEPDAATIARLVALRSGVPALQGAPALLSAAP